MSKHSKPNKVVLLWNKFINSDILPVIWGTTIVITITATLTSLGIVAVRWLLTLLGVIV